MAASEAPSARSIRWARIAAILLAAVLIAEVLSQSFVWAWTGKRFDSLSLYVWSPYGLVRNNPAATSPSFTINANGFRDVKDYQRAKPPGTLRVLMLGGSVLYSGVANVWVHEESRVDSGSTIAQQLQSIIAADPDARGVRVEVLNAAVSFNRIVEESSAYLAEYLWWDPDIVVVFGSANNFFDQPTKADMAHGTYGARAEHLWAPEFQRLANEKTLASLMENVIRVAGDTSAAVAILNRGMQRVVDGATDSVGRASVTNADSGPTPLAGDEDDPRYFDDYAAIADAMVAAARGRNQDIAFFWEYFLHDLPGIKSFSPQEEATRQAVAMQPATTAFHRRMHDRWTSFLADRGVSYVDPIDRLGHESGTVFIDYLHYTRLGNRIMAEETYRVLKPMVLRRVGALRAPAASPQR